MAKNGSETGAEIGVSAVAIPLTAERRMVNVVYSRARDLYRLAGSNKRWWLSVKAYELPAVQLSTDQLYLGPVPSPDGHHWRMAYSADWAALGPGEVVALPVDDPLVRDFEASQL
jgi:hypothetical protein